MSLTKGTFVQINSGEYAGSTGRLTSDLSQHGKYYVDIGIHYWPYIPADDLTPLPEKKKEARRSVNTMNVVMVDFVNRRRSL